MKTIKVAYDSQIFLLQTRGGVSRYFLELIRQFQRYPELGIEPVLPFGETVNTYLLEDSNFDYIIQIHPGLPAYYALVRDSLCRVTNADSVDIEHPTFYLPGFLPKRGNLPVVSTLFDMIPENTARRRWRWNPHFQKERYLKTADAVLSISSSSTEDMRRVYGDSISATTTYLGVDERFRPNLPRPLFTHYPYFLFVGNRSGYKRWDLAVKALAEVSSAFDEVRLVVAGGGEFTSKEKKLMKAHKVEHLIIRRDISDYQLPSLYSNGLALLYTSGYEGFGLPLVEAMASGLPILATDIPINREICDSAANYFPQNDVSNLASLMGAAIRGDANIGSRVKKGLVRAEGFTWYECARKTAEVYKNVMKKRQEARV